MVARKKCHVQQKSMDKAKRHVLQDTNSSSVSDKCLTNKNEIRTMMPTMLDNSCLICSEYGKSYESCGLWAHVDCAGWDSSEGYVCDNC